jgi:hypothetical protein
MVTTKMSEKKNYLSKLEELIEAQKRQIEIYKQIQKEREENSVYLPKEAQDLEHELLRKINNFIPYQNLERRTKMTHFIDSAAKTFRDSKGIAHPLIHYDIGTLCWIDEGFILANNGKKISPIDYFNNTVAHEYGHIVFDENLKGDIKKMVHGLGVNPYVELGEAYAYWFSEQITNLKSPIKQLKEVYETKRGINFQNSIDMYDRFHEMSKDDMFDPKKIADVFRKAK